MTPTFYEALYTHYPLRIISKYVFYYTKRLISFIGYAEFVELLLTHGATIDFPATNGMTALAYAAAAGHQRVVEMLIKFKPRVRNFIGYYITHHRFLSQLHKLLHSYIFSHFL